MKNRELLPFNETIICNIHLSNQTKKLQIVIKTANFYNSMINMSKLKLKNGRRA